MAMIMKIVQILSIPVSATMTTAKRETPKYFGRVEVIQALDSAWDIFKSIRLISQDFDTDEYVKTNLIQNCLLAHTESSNLLSPFVTGRSEEFKNAFIEKAFTDEQLDKLLKSGRFLSEDQKQAENLIQGFLFYSDILSAVLNHNKPVGGVPTLVDFIDKMISLTVASSEDVQVLYQNARDNILDNTTDLIKSAISLAMNIPINDDAKRTDIFILDNQKALFDILDFDFILGEIQKMRFGMFSTYTRQNFKQISEFRNDENNLKVPNDKLESRMKKADRLANAYGDILNYGRQTISIYIRILLVDIKNDSDRKMALKYLEASFQAFKKMVSGVICVAGVSNDLNDEPIDQLLEGLKHVLKDAERIKDEKLEREKRTKAAGKITTA